jgi:BirA family transcriptional regulator, biotin operon repressor / biotin---[acetyl-CoA-carboxylase] ligase
LATPYFQLRRESVSSTQDVARAEVTDLPVLVIAAAQTEGRGRSGSGWLTADRAVAVSLAFHQAGDEDRPLSLMAGIAAVRATDDTALKWPNDVMVGESKAGGILVETSGDVTTVGLGLNLWWPDAPEGMTALYQDDPGEWRYAEIGGLWGAELMQQIDGTGWPIDAYREVCVTLGRQVTWEPGGGGVATDIAPDGALIVETLSGREKLYSGAVRHVRS